MPVAVASPLVLTVIWTAMLGRGPTRWTLGWKGNEARFRQHDLRLCYAEVPIKIVLRGWDCVHECLVELHSSCGAEATRLISEAEWLLCIWMTNLMVSCGCFLVTLALGVRTFRLRQLDS